MQVLIMDDDEQTNLLVVVLDVNPVWWEKHDAQSGPENSFVHCLESVLVFCNSHLLLKHTNKLGFIVCHPKESKFVYPQLTAADKASSNSVLDGKYEVFIALDDTIVDEVKAMVSEENKGLNNQPLPPSLLSGAMAQAMCYIHGVTKDSTAAQKLKSRILVIKGTPDVSTQYMSVMNCIFAAQKNDVVIDACTMGTDSGFLQQAADITGGNYLNIAQISGLLEYLLWMFLPDPSLRECLVLPSSSQIDYRGACFCHRTLVDVGFVCSVCLSIYCKFMPRCMTCQTRFKLPALPMMGKAKKKKKE